MLSLGLFFFFSSRRRHTRSKRDWSSDVCSSDLQMQLMVRALLSMNETPEPSDAADALALALCHLQVEQARRRFGLPDQDSSMKLAPQCVLPGCRAKFNPGAQRVAGCRASYRRDDRSAVTNDHEDFPAPFFLADCRCRSGGVRGGLRPWSFQRQADLSARLQRKLTRIHRDHRAGGFGYRCV